MRIPLLLLAATVGIISAVPLAAQSGQRLTANLTGAAEVPRPGDHNGSGYATVRVNQFRNRICYNLSVRRVQGVTMAHIHRGRAGVAGPVVVNLRAPRGGQSSSCTRVSRALINDIARNPRRFYVNVHSERFPDGAVRGQLRR